MPDVVVSVVRPNGDVTEPIRVTGGDRVPFRVVDAGPAHSCQLHGVGVPFADGMCFELLCDVPGEFPYVSRGFGHGQKRAIGFPVEER